MKKSHKNYCFIDWQNLHLGTSTDGWKIDPYKLRVYLRDKYHISKAYYFLGYVKDENNGLYTSLQEAWFIVVFKKQMVEMTSKKKWNIDSDMIFHVMEKMIEETDKFDKFVIVSWDGDFKILIEYLIKKQRLEKILFPNKRFTSSLYKDVEITYKASLIDVKNKIEYKKREAS